MMTHDPATTVSLLLGASDAHVGTPTTFLFAGLLVGLIACLALEEKIHAKKSIIAGGFAMLCLLLGAFMLPLPFGPYEIGQHTLNIPVYIPVIDWGVLTIILGSSLFVDVTSRCGLFTWIAIRLTKLSGGDPRRLLWAYGIMTVVFSAVLNNVTAMLIVGSLSVVSLERLDRRNLLLGFLVIEGLLTNIGGLLTLISSVPNIIVGTTAGINFVSFFVKSSPYVVIATALTIVMGAKLFGIRALASEEERQAARDLVETFDERDGIDSRGFFWFGVVMLALFIITIATTSVIPHVSDLGMGFVALAFAFVMLLRFKSNPDQFYRAIDWDLLGFFAALFVVIAVMEEAGVLGLIGRGLTPLIELGPSTGSAALLGASAVASSVTDNIPLAAMLAKIMGGTEIPGESPLWWAVIFGANLGGNITPIGSASTLVAVTIIHKHGLKMGFAQFVKMAVPYAIAQIALAMLYVAIVLNYFS